jgi:biopolymer transport protein ExbD
MSVPFRFRPDRAPRRPSLTPLIDVVFLLLVFFMLASRFGVERTLPLGAGGGGGTWEGAPRLVALGPEGLRLNGAPVDRETLVAALAPLLPAPGAPVILRPAEGVPVQALVEVIATLEAGGIGRIVVLD